MTTWVTCRFLTTAAAPGCTSWSTVETEEQRAVKALAETRSKDLFKLACGTEAFETLEAGGALPINGSKGTKYTLHKRAIYCVTRVNDGASLCAVVPSVPLWDHLLGIKLMVENDEYAFLQKANISGGNPIARPRRRSMGELLREYSYSEARRRAN